MIGHRFHVALVVTTILLGPPLLILLSSEVPPARQPSAQTFVPSPVVIGPIAATVPPGHPSHDYPFFSTIVDLASRSYIEEEFFFEGTANRYNIPVDLNYANTPLGTASVIETGLPYRTRMIVRRPVSPLHFNGVVLMEWQNVTFGYDIDAVWLASSEHIMRSGYAWIGVSAQRVGVHGPNGLGAWSPARYGTLDLTANGDRTDDLLGYDVFSQAAQAVRNPVGGDPMAGLPIQTIIAVGVSQGAIRLVAYQNGVQPLAGVFDGFMPLLHGGIVRSDSDAKAFKVLSETDVWREQASIRQPNSELFRRWEVAGTAHLDFRFAQALNPVRFRDIGSVLPTSCAGSPPYSRIPLAFVGNASIDAMADWVKHGIEPPIGPDIATLSIGVPSEIARDSFGNALGGIPLSQHAVPTATNTGENLGPPATCRTFGSHVPFDDETLAALYPDHQFYLARVIAATHETQRDGFIVGGDAAATIRDAARSNIGRR